MERFGQHRTDGWRGPDVCAGHRGQCDALPGSGTGDADRFFWLHVLTGVLVCLAAGTTLLIYFRATGDDGPHRRSLIQVTMVSVAAIVVGVPLAASLARNDRARQRLLHTWMAAGLLVIAGLAWLDGAGDSPIHLILALPVLYGAAACAPAVTAALAAEAVGLCITLQATGGAATAHNYVSDATLALLCMLAIGVAVNRSRSERHIRELTERLIQQATRDELTALLNRRALGEAMRAELGRAGRTGGTVSLITFDLDRFKTVNDTFGHAAGDELLRSVAAGVSACTRTIDLVGRSGGDEFCVICPDTGADQAAAVGARYGVTGSVGAVTVTGAGHNPDEVCRAADADMYRHKPPRTARAAAAMACEVSS